MKLAAKYVAHLSQPVPITMKWAARYVAHLSQSLAATSIPKYLTKIRILHQEEALPDPHVLLMHEVKSALVGVGKLKSLEVLWAKPITPVLLLAFHSVLNLSSLDDVMFFAA